MHTLLGQKVSCKLLQLYNCKSLQAFCFAVHAYIALATEYVVEQRGLCLFAGFPEVSSDSG